jgi:hypothetical protein
VAGRQPATPVACRAPTAGAVEDARTLVRQYAGDATPADVAFFDLKSNLAELQRRGCPPALLGAALTRNLTRKQLQVLFVNLPSDWVRDLQQSITCARADTNADRCARAIVPIEPVGAGKPTSTPYPIAPG